LRIFFLRRAVAILKLLADGKNSFAREVLVNEFVHRHVIKSLAPTAIAAAIDILTAGEPTFSSGATNIGGSELARYGYWMNAG
jgi:hypothetical protein